MSTNIGIVRSVAEISRRCRAGSAPIEQLLLRQSEDLQCRNLMCERVGGSCSCRLSLSLERLRHLSHLRICDLSYNRLGQLPDPIWRLHGLTHLYLDGNDLRQLPTAIGQLQHLQVLSLKDNNDLVELPEEIASLPKLTQLYLTNKQVTLPNTLDPRVEVVRCEEVKIVK